MEEKPFELYGNVQVTPDIPKLTKQDRVRMFRLQAAPRMFQIELARHRSDVPTPMLLGPRQENAPLAFVYTLWELGGEALLLDSIKSGDHRSLYPIAAVTDKLIKSTEIRLDYTRNYFLRSTGGNRGFDGNTHWGYLKYRIFPFFSSDMFGTPGFTAGYVAGIRTDEWDYKQPTHERPIGFAFFGDGAAQQGLFHEVLNGVAARNCKRTPEEIEAVKQFLDPISIEDKVFGGIPMIFIINDNNIACSVTPADEHGNSNLAKRAEGYGNTLGIDVDADNLFSARAAAWQSISEAQRLRSVLVRARTFRGTAHNQDFTAYEDDALARGDFSAVKYLVGHDDAYVKLFKEKWKEDPFVRYGEQLVSEGCASRQELEEIMKEEEAEAKQIIGQALSEPIVTVTGTESERPIFKPFAWGDLPLEKPKNEDCKTQRMGYLESFRLSIKESMEKGAFYLGEDVYFGGVLGLTKGLNKHFGPAQLIDMPISEEWIANFALGLGLYGKTALCEFEFGHFIWDALRSFRIVAPQLFQKNLEFDCIAVAPFGAVSPEIGNGENHESDPTRYIQSMAGIIIFAPSNAYDMLGLMRAARLHRGPKVCLYQISAGKAKKEFSSDVPLEPYIVPLGKAKIVHEGKDVTVVTYGAACVAAACNEALSSEKEGVSIEVIDLRTVYPCDFETIVKSLQKTRCLIIMHEDFGLGGISAYVTSQLKVQYHTHIGDVPVRHVLAKYPFIPSAPALVWDRLPYERDSENDYFHQSEKLRNAIQDILAEKINQNTPKNTHCNIGGVSPQNTIAETVEKIIVTPTAFHREMARRVSLSKRLIPHAGDTTVRADATTLWDYTQKLKEDPWVQMREIKPRLEHIIGYFATRLLRQKEFKVLNSYWDEETKRIIVMPNINIGFVVDATDLNDWGNERLAVPIVHNAEIMPFRTFIETAEAAISRAFSRKLLFTDDQELTFTINNTGVLGGVAPDSVIPITKDKNGKDRPTGMIFNIGAVEEQIDGRRSMSFSLRYDHQISGGRRVMAFAKAMADRVRSLEDSDDVLKLLDDDFQM